MPDWIIAPCLEADKPELVAVCKEQWAQGESRVLPPLVVATIERSYTFERYVEDNWRHMIVGKIDSQMVGFGLQIADEVVGLGVLSTWWRRGIGRALMQHIEQTMRDQHIRVSRLNVYEVNIQAVSFYRALGYNVSASYINTDWGLPVTLLVMTKSL